MTPRYDIQESRFFVLAQIERLKKNSAVVEGLPFGIADLEAQLDRIEGLRVEQDRADFAAQAATDAVHDAIGVALDMAHRNIGAVMARSGKRSPDLLVVGARPLRGRRPPRSGDARKEDGSSPANGAAPDS